MDALVYDLALAAICFGALAQLAIAVPILIAASLFGDRDLDMPGRLSHFSGT
jgi:hypothetical protein